MSVLDYTKNLKLFTPFEYFCINMFIKEYVDTSDPLFAYLNVVKPQDVEIYWYKDSNSQILGGFHLISGLNSKNGKYAIYINNIFEVNELDIIDPYANQFDYVYMTMPTILHELKHYSQYLIYGKLIYMILQLPIIRQYTIEKQAYKVSNYMEQKLEGTLSLSSMLKLKMKYKCSQMYFNKRQLQIKKTLEQNNLDYSCLNGDIIINHVIEELKQRNLIK